jgi:hypothetical protein
MRRRDHGRVDGVIDDGDFNAILSGIFDINAKLAEIRDDLQVIRWLLEDGNDEEEEEQEGS